MNFPDKVLFIYMFLTCTLIGALIVEGCSTSGTFIDPKNALEFFFNATILTGILALVQGLVKIYHRKFKTDTLKKCKQNRLIGFGGIIFFAHLPRVLIYFYPGSEEAGQYISFGTICLIACSLSYLLFASGMESTIRWNESKNKKLYRILDILNTILLFISVLSATEYGGIGSRVFMEIVGCQLAFFALCMVSVREFGGVVNGSMELKSKVADVELEEVKVEGKEGTKAELKLECGICISEYDDTIKTPRILQACGHTICETCADRILKKSCTMLCPFCQKITVVFERSAAKLPKNYETIAAMEWKRDN